MFESVIRGDNKRDGEESGLSSFNANTRSDADIVSGEVRTWASWINQVSGLCAWILRMNFNAAEKVGCRPVAYRIAAFISR